MWEQALKALGISDVPQRFVKLWDGDIHSLKLIASGVNVVFRFNKQDKGYYLRITHPSLRSRMTVETALDFLRHVNKMQAPVCEPIKSGLNNWIEELTHLDTTYIATVVKEVIGEKMKIEDKERSVYLACGQSLARLHQAAESYRPNTTFKYFTWQMLWDEIRARIKKEDFILHKAYQQVDEWLKTLSSSNVDFGLTHGDYWTNNIIWDGKNAYTIDFDNPIYHWFMTDIACLFSGFFDYPYEQRRQYLDWFVEGYRSMRPLAQQWLDNIAMFMLMKDLDLYTWSLYCWQGSRVPGGEQRDIWLAKVYERIVNPCCW